jgi:fructan beta-fructosidase
MSFSLSRLFLIALALTGYFSTDALPSEVGREPWRPLLHFTPRRNWMNDPNGMVFYEGEYHLFFQHNPFGDKPGHLSWGHAVSRDLLKWEELPVAISEEDGVMIFSGSAVVDWKNTSGFGKDGKPPLVAIYAAQYTTKPLQNQQIAYSNDRGRTWTKYSGNPVIDIGEADFRDPKVFWHEPTQRWIMVVAWPLHHQVRFYASKNLKEWTHLSDFGPAGAQKEIWECPDLFPLKIEGTRQKKWVLIVNTFGAPAGGSGCQYLVGEFDGTHFVLDGNSNQTRPDFIPKGRMLADFEGGTYGDWRKEGSAFGDAPAHGTLPNQQPVSRFLGEGLVNSYQGGDGPKGRLTSQEFEISRPYISFLIGGGRHPGKTAINLLINGKVVRTETGNDAEALTWKSWDLREYRGERAKLEIIDEVSEGWGHINVDQIILADEPARVGSDGALWADFGPDFYAAVSWSDIPARDGRRIWLGWMSNWTYAGEVPTSPWRNAMTIPRELSLRRTANGLRLVQQPVRELQTARGEVERLKRKRVSDANIWLKERADLGESFEALADLQVRGTNKTGFVLHFGTEKYVRLTFDPAAGILSVDRNHSGRTDFQPTFTRPIEAPVHLLDGHLHLRLIVDACSIEVLAENDQVPLTSLIFPPVGLRRLELFADSADMVQCDRLELWRLARKN